MQYVRKMQSTFQMLMNIDRVGRKHLWYDTESSDQSYSDDDSDDSWYDAPPALAIREVDRPV